METPQRKYKVKDVDFIIASDAIIDSAIANQPFLQTKRANWSMDFFQTIKEEINQTTQNHLGLDTAKQLRDATQVVYAIQKEALDELAEFKVQVEEDFKDNPSQKIEILNNLGFTSYIFNALKGDQEALIDLLFQFKTNMTTDLSHLIVTKGTSETTINNIITRADQLIQADVIQEGKKGTRK